MGKEVEWEMSPAQRWDLLALSKSDGWKILKVQQLALLGEMTDYLSGANTVEDLHYRRGFRDGGLKMAMLLEKLLQYHAEETQLIERAQQELKVI